jgi:microcystin-dependent protein
MDQYVGEIRMFGGNFAPVGWAFCDGSLLPISENETLFALIGTTYGGDGQTTFALPDLRGRLPLHMGTNPSTGTAYLLGAKSGVETVTLTPGQLPRHTHTVQASALAGTSNTPEGNVWASGKLLYADGSSSPALTMSPGSLSSAGNNQPHSNIMPYLTISFIIALEGIFPSQS